MKKHFASCGHVIHVHIPGYSRSSVPGLSRFALIYLRGEGAQDKALELSGARLELIGGSYSSGENKLVVKPYPFGAKNPDPDLAPKNGALCCGGPIMTWDPVFDATAPEDPNLPKPPPSSG
ncbi:unnamed protein product [Microthlaspi erraticum]|uniref:RRM domain-containing protein n=1 Tax=Microthlaspi erraticum TaxID=1685480 RepID=A0A6D2IMW5_9BRAS|nr:unnamed protein product [Microthlaspi erraticum]